MKLFYAAAPLLVVWYLILPQPHSAQAPYTYKQPLRDWQIVQPFTSADECQAFETEFVDSARQQKALGVLNPAYRDYMFAQCVAADDPSWKAQGPPD